jgi:hypothetical protein
MGISMPNKLAIDELRDLLSLYFGFGYKVEDTVWVKREGDGVFVEDKHVIRALELLPEVVKEYDQLARVNNKPYCSYCDEE